jgi:hypothetical protein
LLSAIAEIPNVAQQPEDCVTEGDQDGHDEQAEKNAVFGGAEIE